MSLPVTRRIARAALLIAAGAAPVVGAAGAAGAAELVQTPNLGGLTAVDSTVEGVSQQGTQTVGDTGRIAGTAFPAAQAASGQTAGHAGEVLGGAVDSTATGLPTGGLPTSGLPTGGLPIGG